MADALTQIGRIAINEEEDNGYFDVWSHANLARACERPLGLLINRYLVQIMSLTIASYGGGTNDTAKLITTATGLHSVDQKGKSSMT